MPLARIGLVPGFALAQKLLEIIGPANTRHLLFTGRLIDARRALAIGMVHEVVTAGDVETATAALARTPADHAPLSLAGVKALPARAPAAGRHGAHDRPPAPLPAARPGPAD